MSSWPWLLIHFDKEKDVWVVLVDGEQVAEGKEVCTLCKKYRYCDYDDGRCGVLS